MVQFLLEGRELGKKGEGVSFDSRGKRARPQKHGPISFEGELSKKRRGPVSFRGKGLGKKRACSSFV